MRRERPRISPVAIEAGTAADGRRAKCVKRQRRGIEDEVRNDGRRLCYFDLRCGFTGYILGRE